MVNRRKHEKSISLQTNNDENKKSQKDPTIEDGIVLQFGEHHNDTRRYLHTSPDVNLQVTKCSLESGSLLGGFWTAGASPERPNISHIVHLLRRSH